MELAFKNLPSNEVTLVQPVGMDAAVEGQAIITPDGTAISYPYCANGGIGMLAIPLAASLTSTII